MPDPSTLCDRATPKRLYGCFRGGPTVGQAACGYLLSPWTPYAVRLRRNSNYVNETSHADRKHEHWAGHIAINTITRGLGAGGPAALWTCQYKVSLCPTMPLNLLPAGGQPPTGLMARWLRWLAGWLCWGTYTSVEGKKI
jgi:hypothetical protein